MILVNIFLAIKKILNDGINDSIMVIGFALGCNMNFKQIFVDGASGILLGVIVTLIGGIVTIGADKLTGGSGVAGAALSSTAVADMQHPLQLYLLYILHIKLSKKQLQHRLLLP